MLKELFLYKKKFDKSNMANSLLNFNEQFNFYETNLKNWIPFNKYNKINNIIIIGMGGSAIGGDFVKNLIYKNCFIPIYICRNYTVPNWVNNNTLIIVSSYSGNTEETISSLKICLDKKLLPIIITTGGELLPVAAYIANNSNKITLVARINSFSNGHTLK